ncbi:MAG: HAD family hydrolase [Candidatus Omnitrophota bacterium]|nr:MAG: HAD family hydrolase [Candidatus Omnitrophota bacterium]
MKIIFLDRDGVINRDPGFGDYVTSWQRFEFLPGAPEAIKKLNRAGYEVVVLSNQAGVSKGLYSRQDLNEITENMLRELKKAGAEVRAVHYCLHQDKDNCACRKPKTGLFFEATRDLKINFADTYFVGDNRRDVLAAQAIGSRSIFVLSGNTRLENLDVKPTFVAQDLLQAVERIVLNNSYS